ncbi:GPW/gp25 family protein [Comamonas sp. Y33R10-2]|uniref:GPW/gp25 family protein n=1 Tax=Comamonas sp. Y33R10-2 TaxID=2853257 RepID=UPI001C5CB269|nr:GPW/gp25 family protein [Comamonas sp. Y33R10-2]QXZ10271.1 GPW/gp25 family protein [Comamonas sp. Y33R10-2]
MNRTTGKRITGVDHLKQSIADILTTPLGSRLERRTYGSLLPGLIDAPDNPATRLRCYAAIASALMNWEPRLRVTRIGLQSGEQPGQAILTIEGEHRPTGQALGISTALQLRGAA